MQEQKLKFDFVIVNELIPTIRIEIIYATDANVYGKKIYDSDTTYLRRGTAEKLNAVQEELASYGYSLKIWDAYRPTKAQFKLWEVCPNGNYIANPYKGYSNHSRGVSVDVTLVDSTEKELAMPSVFDEFGHLADRDYRDVTIEQANNAHLLETVMTKNGFKGLSTEWWHFDDTEKNQYDAVDEVNLKPKMDKAFEDWQAGSYQPEWVNNNEQTRQQISSAIEQGLITGYNHDQKKYLVLNKYISRAEFATLFARLLGLSSTEKTLLWYEPYTSSLLNIGILQDTRGWNEQEWSKPLHRSEMFTWIGQLLLQKDYSTSLTVDMEGMESPDIKATVSAGILKGFSDGSYHLNYCANRAQAVLVLMKLQSVLDLPKQSMAKNDDSSNSIPANQRNREIIISAIGDCVLGTDPSFGYQGSFPAMFNQNKQNPEYFFSGVKPILVQDDLTIANLETTLTTATQTPDKSFQSAAFYFKGDPSFTQILTSGGIEAVNIANNHSYDYCESGYLDTINNLKTYGIHYFGNEYSDRVTVKGVNISLLGYNTLGVLEEGIDLNALKQNIASDLQIAKTGSDLVIVSFHWGIENASRPNTTQIDLAHWAIDNGADLVLGHHPHVIQPIETYKNKYIVYSLGNFCFGGNKNPWNKDTYIFQQKFIFDSINQCTNELQAIAIPCSVSSHSNYNDYRPKLLYGNDANRVIQRVGLANSF